MAYKENWWETFFPDFRPIFDTFPAKVTNAQVRFIREKLKLKRGQRILDCPCGIGRIAIPLAKGGFRVTGVDIMPSYIDELVKTAGRRKVKVDTDVCDMRRIAYDNQFHAAINIWTSFGYFRKESDNLLVLKKIYRALKPGGRFMMQVINRDYIIADYQPTHWGDMPGGKMLVENKIDYARSVMDGKWIFMTKEGESVHQMFLRVYSYHELVAMFEKVGFTDIEGWGTLKSDPVDRKHHFIFIAGQK